MAMQVIIRGSNARETLSLIDPKTGCDYVADFIGIEIDSVFTKSKRPEVYEPELDHFKWYIEN